MPREVTRFQAYGLRHTATSYDIPWYLIINPYFHSFLHPCFNKIGQSDIEPRNIMGNSCMHLLMSSIPQYRLSDQFARHFVARELDINDVYVGVLSTLTVPCFAWTISWRGDPRAKSILANSMGLSLSSPNLEWCQDHPNPSGAISRAGRIRDVIIYPGRATCKPGQIRTV